MAKERLVAVSYPADEEFAQINSEVLAGTAEIACTYELPDPQRAQILRRADALLAWELPKEIPAGALDEAERLRFVQLLSAGVDKVDFSVPQSGQRHADGMSAKLVPAGMLCWGRPLASS